MESSAVTRRLPSFQNREMCGCDGDALWQKEDEYRRRYRNQYHLHGKIRIALATCIRRHNTPERGVRSGRFGYNNGRIVSEEYAADTMTSSAAETAIMIVLTGKRKATRPAKKKISDACRSSGISSTTACMLNLFRP